MVTRRAVMRFKSAGIHGLLLGSLFLLGGCASLMVGATHREAHNRFLLVGKEPGDFGLRRLEYLSSHFPPVGEFLAAQTPGQRPEMIRSYLDQGRAALLLCYIAKNKVYDFVIRESGNPKSMALRSERTVSERERAEYERLKGK